MLKAGYRLENFLVGFCGGASMASACHHSTSHHVQRLEEPAIDFFRRQLLVRLVLTLCKCAFLYLA